MDAPNVMEKPEFPVVLDRGRMATAEDDDEENAEEDAEEEEGTLDLTRRA